MKKVLFYLVCSLFIVTQPIFATIGVGVGTGKIQVDEKLKPGIIYTLPPLTVINTGDEESDYEVNIQYHDKQPQLKPLMEWFTFSPQRFHLSPGQTQVVTMRINMPLKVEPGEYFAYLDAHPFKKTVSQNTTIGVAAAAKLYFTVEQADMFLAVYYKLLSLWKLYQPWTTYGAIALGVIILIAILKRFLNIEINVKKSKK